MAVSSVPYEYQSLDHEDDVIRLLTINNVDQNDLVSCSIRHERFSSRFLDTRRTMSVATTRYFAVSYMWGDGSELHQIHIDGRAFLVRTNLWNFLKRAKTFTWMIGIPLWIDAICINQEMVKERNHQVRLMSRIYSSASTVLVWLGTDGDRRNDISTDATEVPISQCSTDLSHGGKVSESALDPRYYTDPKIQTEITQRVCSILQSPYWRRMWIVQELQLAKRIRLIYGHYASMWHPFWDCVYQIRKHLATDPDDTAKSPMHMCSTEVLALFNASIANKHFTRVKKSKVTEFAPTYHLTDPTVPESPNPIDLMNLIHEYRDQECSDVKDRVIALLSLVDGGHTVYPDYSLTPADLALNICGHFGGDPMLLELLFDVLNVEQSGLASREIEAVLPQDIIWWDWYAKNFYSAFCCGLCKETIVMLCRDSTVASGIRQRRWWPPQPQKHVATSVRCVMQLGASTGQLPALPPLLESMISDQQPLRTVEESQRLAMEHLRDHHSDYIPDSIYLDRVTYLCLRNGSIRDLELRRFIEIHHSGYPKNGWSTLLHDSEDSFSTITEPSAKRVVERMGESVRFLSPKVTDGRRRQIASERIAD